MVNLRFAGQAAQGFGLEERGLRRDVEGWAECGGFVWEGLGERDRPRYGGAQWGSCSLEFTLGVPGLFVPALLVARHSLVSFQSSTCLLEAIFTLVPDKACGRSSR